MFKAAKLLWQYKGFRYKIKLTTTHLLRHSLEVIPHTIFPGRAGWFWRKFSGELPKVELFFWLTRSMISRLSIIHQPEITPNLGGFPLTLKKALLHRKTTMTIMSTSWRIWSCHHGKKNIRLSPVDLETFQNFCRAFFTHPNMEAFHTSWTVLNYPKTYAASALLSAWVLESTLPDFRVRNWHL